MTKKAKVINLLKQLQSLDDTEVAHSQADDILLEYIADKDIEKEYDKIKKWYA